MLFLYIWSSYESDVLTCPQSSGFTSDLYRCSTVHSSHCGPMSGLEAKRPRQVHSSHVCNLLRFVDSSSFWQVRNLGRPRSSSDSWRHVELFEASSYSFSCASLLTRHSHSLRAHSVCSHLRKTCSEFDMVTFNKCTCSVWLCTLGPHCGALFALPAFLRHSVRRLTRLTICSCLFQCLVICYPI